MSNYQEAANSASISKQTSKNAPKTQIKAKTSEQKAVLCPNCNASVPEGAVFCPECGFNLNAPIFCPECGAETTPDADICQACGAWLLDGQCTFCYANLDPNAEFCADCGNPKGGIKCPDCGNLSIFDFCSKCGKALTEGAAIAMDLVKKDPNAIKMMEAIQEQLVLEAKLAEIDTLINNPSPILTYPDDDFEDDDIYDIPDTPAPPPVKKSLFSDSQVSAIMKTADNREASAIRQAEAAKRAAEIQIKQEEDRKRAQAAVKREAKMQFQTQRGILEEQERERLRKEREELERRRQKAISEAREALGELQNKTFLNQQEARRFYNAVKTLGITPDGWRCNAYDCLHEDGPNGCANPSLRGHWEYMGRPMFE